MQPVADDWRRLGFSDFIHIPSTCDTQYDTWKDEQEHRGAKTMLRYTIQYQETLLASSTDHFINIFSFNVNMETQFQISKS